MIPESDEDSDIEIFNPKEQSTRKPRGAFQYQYSLKQAANQRGKYHYMGETITVTDEPSLIPYISKYFESIADAPQITEPFTSLQQPVNLEVDPYIATINQK